jgi:NAD(P)-dependent dehydrogenase (short-subunit alcohol dehydrogenase family)
MGSDGFMIERTALVTGSTSGIGRATALRLARDGVFVVVSGRDERRGQETCDAVREAGGNCALVLADLRKPDAAQTLAREAVAAAGGPIDILVNNAGGGHFPDGNQAKPAVDVSPADFEAVFTLNTRAPYLLAAALAPDMLERGRGVIVNVLAISGARGYPGVSVFGGAKAAVASFTRTWAVEWGPAIRVNAVDPGSIRTPIHDGNEALLAGLAPVIPAKRVGEPGEVAAVIAFLASPAASYLSGATVPVDGGLLIAP